MMNKDNKNDKIQKIVKKGLTLSLCAVLAGGLAAGSFEGMNRLTGWNEGTTVQAASNNENKLTYAKSEKKADEENDLKSDASEDTSDSSTKATGSMDVSDIVAETLPLCLLSYPSQINLYRRYSLIMECTECMDMLHSRKSRK